MLEEKTINNFAGGNGTIEDPYLVENVEQLNSIRYNLDKCFKQIDDINNDPNKDNYITKTIGYFIDDNHEGNEQFDGIYDGNGYEIITSRTLFGEIGSEGIIKNVDLDNNFKNKENEYFGYDRDTGSIARTNYGQIKNCDVKAEVNGIELVGGIVGTNWGLISDCNIKEVVKGEFYVGGIAGENHGKIHNCKADGFREGENCGGIVGENKGVIKECVSNFMNKGKLSIGGIVGRNHSKVIDCISLSICSGVNIVGGVVACNEEEGQIINCLSRGDINFSLKIEYKNYLKDLKNSSEYEPPYKSKVAGVSGINEGIIKNSYSDVNIYDFNIENCLMASGENGKVVNSYYNKETDKDKKDKIFDDWENADTKFIKNQKLSIIEKEMKRRNKLEDLYEYFL